MPTRPCISTAALLAAACGFAGPTLAPAHAEEPTAAVTPTPRKAIPFRSLEDAAAESAAQERVLVIYFTAEWCGWCRKMESSTFADAGVIAGSAALSWAEVDIDARPDVAAVFGTYGVPALVFLNARGEYLGDRAGYVTTPQMLELLGAYRDKGLAPGAVREGMATLYRARAALAEARTDEEVVDAVRQTLGLLADPQQRPQREQLRHAVITSGPRAWPALVAALADERLAVRAAASDLFRASAPGSPAVDPFAEPADRATQVAAAQRWLSSQVPLPPTLPPPAEAVEAG